MERMAENPQIPDAQTSVPSTAEITSSANSGVAPAGHNELTPAQRFASLIDRVLHPSTLQRHRSESLPNSNPTKEDILMQTLADTDISQNGNEEAPLSEVGQIVEWVKAQGNESGTSRGSGEERVQENVTLETQQERTIPDDERLVPDDYQIDVEAAIMRCAGQEFPVFHYPEVQDRLHWTQDQIDTWKADGMHLEELIGPVETGIVNDHPERQKPSAQGKLDIYDFTDGQVKDPNGNVVPVSEALHPYWEQMLLEGKGIAGFGYNRTHRAKAVDGAVLFVDEEGYLTLIDIVRGDTGQHALVGGFFDPGDPNMLSAIFREMSEETNLDPQDLPRIEEVYDGLTADARDTLLGSRETNLTVFLPTPEQARQICQGIETGKYEAKDDAKKVQPTRVTQANLDVMWGMHPELVRLAVKAWQERTGLVVDQQGRVGKAPVANSQNIGYNPRMSERIGPAATGSWNTEKPHDGFSLATSPKVGVLTREQDAANVNVMPESKTQTTEHAGQAKLERFQQYLVKSAYDALALPSFEERNIAMARAVALESTSLTVDSLRSVSGDRTISEPGVREAFQQAAVEAGKAFTQAFDAEGHPLKDHEAEYKVAMQAAGGIALKHLPDALAAAGLGHMTEARVAELFNNVGFNDVIRLTAAQLGVPDLGNVSKADIINLVKGVVKADDSFVNDIEGLKFTDGQDYSVDERQVLDMGIRLANTTWKVGQVDRAAWEGNESRIDPNYHERPDAQLDAKGNPIQGKEAFQAYDLLKQTMYNKRISEGNTPQEALLRVAFEVWKDVKQLQTK